MFNGVAWFTEIGISIPWDVAGADNLIPLELALKMQPRLELHASDLQFAVLKTNVAWRSAYLGLCKNFFTLSILTWTWWWYRERIMSEVDMLAYKYIHPQSIGLHMKNVIK